MSVREYPVLLTEGRDYVLASVCDLGCEALGSSPELAVAAVERLAGRVLRRYEDAQLEPPPPSRLSLGRIELPVRTRTAPPRQLQVVQRAGVHRPQRCDRATGLSRR
jgi:hypothetical protein